MTNSEKAAEGRKQLLLVLNDCGASQQDVSLIDLQRQYFARYGIHMNKALLRQYFGKGQLLPISQIFMSKDVNVQTNPKQTGSLFFRFKRPLNESLEDKEFMGENKKVDCAVVTTMSKEMNFEKRSTDTQSAVSPIFNKNNTNSIAIELDGHHFFADLNILIAQSPYFRVRVELERRKVSEEDGSSQHAWPKIQSPSSGSTFSTGLEFVTTNALNVLHRYFCGCKLGLTESNVFYILKSIKILKLEELIPTCVNFVDKRLFRPENVFELKAAFADVPLFVDTAFNYIKTNFMAVKESDEFLKLDVDELIYLLRSDELFVDSENDVFVAAMNWLNFETGNRQQFAASVLGAVRWPLLSCAFLNDVVLKSPLALSVCSSEIAKVFAYHVGGAPDVCAELLDTDNVKPRLARPNLAKSSAQNQNK